MKTFFVFISIFCLIVQVKAQISKIEAEIAAMHLLRKLQHNSYSIANTNVITKGNNVICYDIELSPVGFILISSEKISPPVIAYSFESSFGKLNFSNPLYSMTQTVLSNKSLSNIDYTSDWDEILNNQKNTDTTFQQWPAETDGWLSFNWTQNAPYNNFCPMDPVTSQRSIAGCPSVAMAMILNFHKTTNNTQFDDNDDYYHNYAGRQYWIDNDYLSRDFPSFPELNTYLDTLNAHYTNGIPITNNDKAALVFACGVAATQVYTSSGSGTFGVNQAYEAYQRFNFTTSTLLDTTNIDLFPRLIQNMKDTLPAHLAIVDPSWSSGHNVVVDGYNTDNYYHLNFGWGGSYNGWYLIPQQIPYSLTVIEGVVLDIIKSPATRIPVSEKEYKSVQIFPNPSVNGYFKVKYTSEDFENVCMKIFTIEGTEIYNNTIPKKSGTIEIPVNSEKLRSGYYIIELKSGNNIYRNKLIVQ